MLQNIRDNLQGTIAKVIIGLIVVPFALFGIEAFFTGGGVQKVAEVNGELIFDTDLKVAMELQRRRLLSSTEGKIDASQLEESALRGPALDALIDRSLMQKLAMDSGLRVSDAMLDQVIVSDANFQDNGTFSQARFQALLGNSGMNPATYKKLLREEMLITQVLSGLSASEFATPHDVTELARISQQSLDVRYLTIPVGSGADVTVEESAIAAYFDANRESFRSEETVSVEYIELTIEDLFKPVPEPELRKEYESRVVDFKGKTERHAAHIMLTELPDDEAKQKLSALRERIMAGEDFAVLAKAQSTDVGSAESGGDLGVSTGDAFPPEFEAALVLLQPGELSQPVQSEAGWHLIKLLEQRIQDAPAFEEMRADMEKEMQLRTAEPLFVERSEKLDELTFTSDGLQEAATELGLAIEQSPAFSRTGGTGLFADSRVINAAFSKEVAEQSQNSPLLEISKESVMVLRLKEHQPARQLELAEVHDRIRDTLLETMVRERAVAAGQAVLTALRGGQSMEDVARAHGYQWQVVLEHRRGASGLDPELSQAVFTAPRAGVATVQATHVAANGDVVAFEATNFHDGSLDKLLPEQHKSLQAAIQLMKGRESIAQYQKRLRASADVEVL